MKLNKLVYIFLLIIIFVWATLDIFPYAIHAASTTSKEPPMWLHIIVAVAGIIGGSIIKYSYKHHKNEAKAAQKTLYTPKNKYGWYALIFFILWMTSYLLFVFFQMK